MSVDVLIPLGVFILILGGGMGAMLWAYVGSGSQVVLFPEPVALPVADPVADSDAVETAARMAFQKGCDAFLQGNYRQSVNQFNRAIERDSTLAEAYHNRGLAIANLRQINEALANLVRASELYAQQDNPSGIALIKQHLEVFNANKKSYSSLD